MIKPLNTEINIFLENLVKGLGKKTQNNPNQNPRIRGILKTMKANLHVMGRTFSSGFVNSQMHSGVPSELVDGRA